MWWPPKRPLEDQRLTAPLAVPYGLQRGSESWGTCDKGMPSARPTCLLSRAPSTICRPNFDLPNREDHKILRGPESTGYPSSKYQ